MNPSPRFVLAVAFLLLAGCSASSTGMRTLAQPRAAGEVTRDYTSDRSKPDGIPYVHARVAERRSMDPVSRAATIANMVFKSGQTYDGGGRMRSTGPNTPPVLEGGTQLTGECKIEAGATNVTIRGYMGVNAAIAMQDGSHRKNITFEDVEMVGSPPNYFNNNNNAFLLAGTSEGTKFKNVVIRDGGYGIIAYNAATITAENLWFVNRYQWAHLMNLGKGSTVWARGWGQQRMTIENQRHGDGAFQENTTFTIITCTPDGKNAWTRGVMNDSFGASIVPDGAINTVCKDFYIVGVPNDYNGPWLKTDPNGQRPGMGIEAGSKSITLENCTVAGKFAGHVIVSSGGPNAGGTATIRNVGLYGDPAVDWWGRNPDGSIKYNWVERESGSSVAIIETNVTKSRDYNARPPMPGGTVPIPPPTSNDAPTNVIASDITHNSVKISWADKSADETQFVVVLTPGNPHDPKPTRTAPANATSVSFKDDVGLNPNWEYAATVTAITPRGTSVSQPIKFQMKVKPSDPLPEPEPEPEPEPPTSQPVKGTIQLRFPGYVPIDIPVELKPAA
jgi:hypothetical protein